MNPSDVTYRIRGELAYQMIENPTVASRCVCIFNPTQCEDSKLLLPRVVQRLLIEAPGFTEFSETFCSHTKVYQDVSIYFSRGTRPQQP